LPLPFAVNLPGPLKSPTLQGFAAPVFEIKSLEQARAASADCECSLLSCFRQAKKFITVPRVVWYDGSSKP
jgi:hypothetical protein